MGKLIVALIVLLAFCCSAAFATPTLNLASGYVQLPDASALKAGRIDVAAAYVRSAGTNELSKLDVALPCDGNGYNVRVLAGISDRAEIGAGYLNINKSAGDAQAFTIAGKLQLYEKPEQGLTLALGAGYRAWSSDMKVDIPFDTLKVDLPAVTSVYLALDKKWKKPVGQDWLAKTTIGVIYDHFGDSKQKLESGLPFFVVPADLPISDTGKVKSQGFVSPFIGLMAINREGWALMGEYKPRLRKDDFSYASEVWSVAVRKSFKDNLTATAGFTNFNIPYSDSNAGIFFDVSLAFGP